MAGKIELSAKQNALLAALLDTSSVAGAAKQAGMSERTAYRLLEDPGFQEELRARRVRIVDHAQMQLQRACGAAVMVLVRNLSSSTPAAVQIAAAKAILDYSVQSAASNFEQRLAELEQLMAEQRGGAGLRSVIGGKNRGA
jgi:hypothetical protein